MELIRQWLTSVVTVSMLLSLVQMLIPKGGVQKIASFTGGLLLLLALLRPLLGADLSDLLPDPDGRREAVARRQEELAEETENLLEQRIAEKTAAYISDKATELGVKISVRVGTTISPEGVSVPSEVVRRWCSAVL